jgi:hypothetical protein
MKIWMRISHFDRIHTVAFRPILASLRASSISSCTYDHHETDVSHIPIIPSPRTIEFEVHHSEYPIAFDLQEQSSGTICSRCAPRAM